ncbi:MAG: coiled-coil [archaeon GW2011_AR5]|nr:MAG: coiled-coil [archaeon GW2011_AR5]
MSDKVVELEERLNRLEERLKLTFVEIEKRMQPQQPGASGTPANTMDVGDRIDELEDLLLLLQLENTKLKERVGEGLDFGITPSAPDVSERLNRIESELGNKSVPVFETDEEGNNPAIISKLAELEERINAIPSTTIKVPKDVEKHVKHEMEEDMRQMEKRIKTLEALLAQRGREDLEKESNVLADVHAILKRG